MRQTALIPSLLDVAREDTALPSAGGLGEIQLAQRESLELLERIERRVARLETTQERQCQLVEEQARRLEADRPRRDFPAWFVAKCLRTVRRHGGLCPCCHEQRIVDDQGRAVSGAEMDHWLRPWDASPSAGWLVCRECNRRLGRAGGVEREDDRPAFVLFQRRLAAMPDDPGDELTDDCTLPIPFPPARRP